MALPHLLGSIIRQSCSHEFSWPHHHSAGGYYQTCARCGNQYRFDWEAMARGEEIRKRLGPRTQTPPPTMTQWSERAPRFSVRRPIFYRLTGSAQFRLGVLLDISESGVLLECEPVIEPGQKLEMIFAMPPEISGQLNRNVLGQGVVARIAVSELGTPLIGVSLSGYRFLSK